MQREHRREGNVMCASGSSDVNRRCSTPPKMLIKKREHLLDR